MEIQPLEFNPKTKYLFYDTQKLIQNILNFLSRVIYKIWFTHFFVLEYRTKNIISGKAFTGMSE